MDLVSEYIEQLKGKGLRLVLPEGEDARVVLAARRIKDERIAEPILLGTQQQIQDAADEAGVCISDMERLDPARSDRVAAFTQAYRDNRPDVSEGAAMRIVRRPLFFGGMMLATGDVDAMVGGAVHHTAIVVRAGMLTIGLADGIETPSSFFIMVLPGFRGLGDKPVLYADCAVSIAPTPNQLADIALASADSARRLLREEPRVAMLSFSTQGSASHAEVRNVRDALDLVRRRNGHILIDGEFQFDTAVVPDVAARKLKRPSNVAGRANVLVFPDLNAGNIGYKITQYVGGAQAIGPLLQGFRRPMSDLSRGADVNEIVSTAGICLYQALQQASEGD